MIISRNKGFPYNPARIPRMCSVFREQVLEPLFGESVPNAGRAGRMARPAACGRACTGDGRRWLEETRRARPARTKPRPRNQCAPRRRRVTAAPTRRLPRCRATPCRSRRPAISRRRTRSPRRRRTSARAVGGFHEGQVRTRRLVVGIAPRDHDVARVRTIAELLAVAIGLRRHDIGRDRQRLAEQCVQAAVVFRLERAAHGGVDVARTGAVLEQVAGGQQRRCTGECQQRVELHGYP